MWGNIQSAVIFSTVQVEIFCFFTTKDKKAEAMRSQKLQYIQ